MNAKEREARDAREQEHLKSCYLTTGILVSMVWLLVLFVVWQMAVTKGWEEAARGAQNTVDRSDVADIAVGVKHTSAESFRQGDVEILCNTEKLVHRYYLDVDYEKRTMSMRQANAEVKDTRCFINDKEVDFKEPKKPKKVAATVGEALGAWNSTVSVRVTPEHAHE